MKKKETPDVQVFHLPNHSWIPVGWIKPGSEFDKPDHVLRREKGALLVRNQPWERAKEPRYGYSKEFCGANRPNETWKPVDLQMWSEASIQILAQKAQARDSDAALELARLALEATRQLTKIGKAKPELLRPLARHFRAWPVIKKKNAKLSEDEKQLFAEIQLGADDFLELDAQSAKWKMDDAGIIAYNLLVYVRDARESTPRKDLYYGEFGTLAKKLLPADFCDANAVNWWNFAKRILLFSYPKPHAIEELNRLVTNEAKRKSPGRIDAAIIRILKSRFLSFARNTY